MTTDTVLRPNGRYRFGARTYTAVDLSTGSRPWRATALIDWSPGAPIPSDIVYLRHRDGILLGITDFQPIGTAADLVDTGETDEYGAPHA